MRRAEVEFLPPHLVSVVFYDMMDELEVLDAFERIEGHVGELSFYLLEIHTMQTSGATPAGRRLAAERMKALPERAMTVVVDNFAQRAMANLLLKAAQVLERGRNNQYKVCKSKQESRDWLDARARMRLGASE